jgi:catechol 2,3-dioxygenase-like lactoylglutathione lyase family enzyme
MELGQHHIALNVKNLQVSKDFYLKLGFTIDERFSNTQQKWLIIRNGTLVIGLYEGIIPRNTLTFTPNDNIFNLQKHLKQKGIPFVLEAKEDAKGLKHFLLVDPDGNPLFFEQH